MNDTAKQKPPKQGFFAVDHRCWAEVCNVSMNAAVAYLVLARGSGPDNVQTTWSVQAIEKYTRISRPRANKAIAQLKETGLIVQTRDGTKPKYEIQPWAPKKGNRATKTDPEWIWLPNRLVDGVANETPPIERVRQIQDVMALRLFIDLYYIQNLRGL